jgi:Leucine-rich repeat (LRR) protein
VLKLERLPDSFGGLTNLHHMDLSWCEKLERLPDSLGSFSSLKYLNSSCCPNLTISSDTLGNIKTLEHVDLSGCEKIEVWPSQLAQQRSLKILKLTGTNFKELPSAIGVLSDLDVLWIGSPLLNTLPPSVGDLRNLKELVLKDCRELKCLPASVGRLSQLTKLEVVGCPVMELPFKKVRGQRETVGTLKSDSSIHKYMPGLRNLILQEDTEISEVSFEEGVCPNLQEFFLVECINVVEVVTLPNTLIEVKLSSCYNLRSIEGLCGLAMLRELYIKECNELQELPSVKTLVSLERVIHAVDCVKLKSIRDLAQLTKLWYLGCFGVR